MLRLSLISWRAEKECRRECKHCLESSQYPSPASGSGGNGWGVDVHRAPQGLGAHGPHRAHGTNGVHGHLELIGPWSPWAPSAHRAHGANGAQGPYEAHGAHAAHGAHLAGGANAAPRGPGAPWAHGALEALMGPWGMSPRAMGPTVGASGASQRSGMGRATSADPRLSNWRLARDAIFQSLSPLGIFCQKSCVFCPKTRFFSSHKTCGPRFSN